MRVYELMRALSKLPAGAEVEFRGLMTLEEFAQSEIVDNIDGKDAYSVGGTVNEVFITHENLITLYK